MVAFTAHYFGLNPMDVQQWRPGEIVRWYKAAQEEHEKVVDWEQGKFFGILVKMFGG